MSGASNQTVAHFHHSLLELRARLAAFFENPRRKWLQQNWITWRRQLDELVEDAQRPATVSVSLVGNTGTGKSTLLNALLECPLLPVSNNRSCTSAIVAVKYAEQRFRARAVFLSRAEWLRQCEKEVESCLVDGASQIAVSDLPEELREKYLGFYQLTSETMLSVAALHKVVEKPIIAELFERGADVVESNDIKDIHTWLKQYVTSFSILWPLVKSVDIAGPFTALRDGVEIVDLPGLNDPNEARNQLTEDWLTKCRYVWMVFQGHRNLTRDSSMLLLSPSFARRMIMADRIGSLTFIATSTDNIDFDAAIGELGLAPDCTDDEIVARNNDRIVDTIKGKLERIVYELSPEGREGAESVRITEKLLHESRIFAVSAQTYLRLKSQSRSAPKFQDVTLTGIPALQSHLQGLSKHDGATAKANDLRSQLQQLLKSIFDQLGALREGIQSQKNLTSQTRMEMRAAISTARAFLDRKLPECNTTLSQHLTEDKRRLEERITEAFQAAEAQVDAIAEGWARLQWNTLRAVFRSGGRYNSTRGEFDLIEDVEKPLHRVIMFEWRRTFGDGFKDRIRTVTNQLSDVADSYQELVLARMRPEDMTNVPNLGKVVRNSITTAVTTLRQQHEHQRLRIDDFVGQKNREVLSRLTRDLAASLADAFQKASNEQGSGMKKRMMNIVADKISEFLPVILADARTALLAGVDSIQQNIERMFKDDMSARVVTAADTIAHNVEQVIGRLDSEPQAQLERLDEVCVELNEAAVRPFQALSVSLAT